MKIRYVGLRRPWIYFYHMFEGKMLALGPFVIEWKDKSPPPILVHHWRAYGYHGVGNLTTPVPMTEADALKWISEVGHVAYVDREAGFIFYRPKE